MNFKPLDLVKTCLWFFVRQMSFKWTLAIDHQPNVCAWKIYWKHQQNAHWLKPELNSKLSILSLFATETIKCQNLSEKRNKVCLIPGKPWAFLNIPTEPSNCIWNCHLRSEHKLNPYILFYHTEIMSQFNFSFLSREFYYFKRKS